MYQGKLLLGKYASRRSAGNFLAGYNAAGKGYGLDETMKVFGSVEQSRGVGGIPHVLLYGAEYGLPPYYGEQGYSGRMQIMGYKSKEGNLSNWYKILQQFDNRRRRRW
jgi:hypothetical protein